MVFAVVTISSVFIYDTQHVHPIARLSGQHLAPINDAAWTGDGQKLAVCSSDGYVTIVRFTADALGEVLEEDLVPKEVKYFHPCLYNYTPTNAASVAAGAAAEDEDLVQDPQSNAVSSPIVIAEVTTTAACTAIQLGSGINLPATSVEQQQQPQQGVEDSNNMPSSATKKRKRIQTTMLGSCTLDSFLLSKPTVDISSPSQPVKPTASKVEPALVVDLCDSRQGAPVVVATQESHESSHPVGSVNDAVSPSNDQREGSAPTSTKKKRIAPTLISPLPST